MKTALLFALILTAASCGFGFQVQHQAPTVAAFAVGFQP